MSTFNDIINSGPPVLVDFYADWCQPCRMLTPILGDLKSRVSGKARILKVDIDKNAAVAAHYGVQAVPTLLLFKNGQVVWRKAGVTPLPELLNIIAQHAS